SMPLSRVALAPGALGAPQPRSEHVRIVSTFVIADKFGFGDGRQKLQSRSLEMGVCTFHEEFGQMGDSLPVRPLYTRMRRQRTGLPGRPFLAHILRPRLSSLHRT